MRQLTLCTVCIWASASAFAIAADNIVLPAGAEGSEGDTILGLIRPGGAFRLGWVYDAVDVLNEPQLITEMRFRPDKLAPAEYRANYRDLDLSLAVVPESLALSDKLGVNQRNAVDWSLVYTGDAAMSTTSPSDELPRPFDLKLPLMRPFVYDPAKGNLYVDFDLTGVVDHAPAWDAQITTPFAVVKYDDGLRPELPIVEFDMSPVPELDEVFTPGDVNLDEDVDIDDYQMWRGGRQFHQAVSQGDLQSLLSGDVNLNGNVEFFDFHIIRSLGSTQDSVAPDFGAQSEAVSSDGLNLLVDTTTSQVRISNGTDNDLALTYFSLSSEANAFRAGWNGFADQEQIGWHVDASSRTEIRETNFTHTTLLPSNSHLDIGASFITPNRDITAELGTADGDLYSLNVVFGTFGDCNGDGIVDASDLTCVCSSGNGELADVFAATGLQSGDIDADGAVGFSDFLVLSSNFGMQAKGYLGGDLDCDGIVGFSDFLSLSANYSETVVQTTSVPEPSCLMLTSVSCVLPFLLRKQRSGLAPSSPSFLLDSTR